ncbi:MAG TPA: hypothetical protein VLV86_19595 [Vicinamibacterales bacterium]|nr:hypothetical protein [Vicinamibacterales bacterium]
MRGPENWRALLCTGANMLIVGPRCALDAFLAAAADDMVKPAWLVKPCEDIPTDRGGTLVLYDASMLDEQQQHSLGTALAATDVANLQVVSLSEAHLWHADGSPSLPLDLYYRLNTICLELDAEPERRRERRYVLPRSTDHSKRSEPQRLI